MRDVEKFRKLVIDDYCKRAVNKNGRRSTQIELAREIGLSKGELNKRLHEYKDRKTGRAWHLTEADVLAIVRALAEWGAITTQWDARELFELADYSIDSIDWNKEPLKRLRATPDQPPNSTSINYLRNSFLLHSYLSPNEVFERVHLNEFTGRTWLEKDLDFYLNNEERDRGAWLLVGAAGAGKTSFLAYLVRERGYIHLFSEQAPGDAHLPRALHSLATQLVRRFDLGQFVGTDGFFLISTSSPDFLPLLLNAASEKLGVGEKLVVVIDALDEAGVPPGGNVLGIPKRLPRGVYLILSQRPVPLSVILQIDPPAHRVNLGANEKDNHIDILTYLHHIVSIQPIAERLAKKSLSAREIISTLSQKSSGNWAYLHYIIEEIRQNQRDLSDLASLPNGLVEYYAHFWERLRQGPEWDSLYAPVLTTLGAVYEPISLLTLKEWANVHVSTFDLQRLLKEEWGAFFYEQDGTCRFYHASLKEFLAGRVDLERTQPSISGLLDELRERSREAHHRIVSALNFSFHESSIKDSARDSRKYGLRYLPRHLSVLGRAGHVYALIENVGWRRAKIEFDPSYYALAQDFELAIRLSRDAIEKALSEQKPVQYVLGLLSPFCAHSLFLTQLRSTASNVPFPLLGVLTHLGQSKTALGYAQLLNSQDAYQHIVEGLEASGKIDEAADLRLRVAGNRTETAVSSALSQRYSRRDEPAASLVRKLLTQGDPDAALKAVESIPDVTARDEGLIKVALFLSQQGREVNARSVVDKITALRAKVTCLSLLAKVNFDRAGNSSSFHQDFDLARRLAESTENSVDKIHSLISISKVLLSLHTEDDNGAIEKELASKLAHQAAELAHEVNDIFNRAMAFVQATECFLGLEETGVAIELLEKALEAAAVMVNVERPYRDGFYNPPFGLQVLWTLPHLFMKAGNVEKAREIIQQAISAAKRLREPINSATGLWFDIGDTVGQLACKKPAHLVKGLARDILPEGEFEAALWSAADLLLRDEQHEEALAFIEDGRLAPYCDRDKIISVLTRAAVWLVRSKQFVRAQQISEVALHYTQEAPAAEDLAYLLSGIAAGLGRSGLPNEAHLAVDLSLQAAGSIHRPYRWLLFQGYIDTLLEVSTANQAAALADRIVKMAITYKGDMEQNENNNIRESWVDMLTLAAKAYAKAGHIDQATETLDRFGDDYGKGRRYLWGLGQVYMGLKKGGGHEKLEEFRQTILDFANSMLEYAKGILSHDSDDLYGNGMITDTLVTLARSGAVERALEEAKKIQDSYYRALCLGTIVYEASSYYRQGEYVDIAQQILATAEEMPENGRSVLCARAIKALARSGRVDLAEQAVQEYWFTHEDIQISFDAFGRVTLVKGTLEPKYLDDVPFADVLAEMIVYGSRWSAYVVADLFIKGYIHIWQDLAIVAPAFGSVDIAKDLWQRIRKLALISGEWS